MQPPPLRQGLGVPQRYLGLPDELARLSTARIAILPVAFDMTTTYQHGTQHGPAALIEASRALELYDIETQSEVYKYGIHTLPTITPETEEDMRNTTYKHVMELLAAHKFTVTLGGEHTISWAPICAHSQHFPGLSVLQLDAHADLPDTYNGNAWSHACVMARVRELPGVDHVVAVGIRSLSAEEVPKIEPERTFFCHELFDSSAWMYRVLDCLNENVYITFDLDVFDCSLMPSTGTPEPGGLYWPAVTQLLKLVARHKNIVGFDIVELCPQPNNPAPDFLAAKLLYKLLSYKFGNL